MAENFEQQTQQVLTHVIQPPTQQSLPNSTAVLVLGILSIVPSCCTGVIGLTLGIIALVLAGKSEREYRNHPGVYTVTSYKNMTAGKICAIIGTCLGAISFAYILFYLLILGTALSALPMFEMFS
ncbi:MAG: hypothetical protein LBV39_06845 [Bacteroidales bacterium]|jgi:hypothetical protein|nr:hypothetical protein [Bacteroidales bacterium]